MLQNYRIRANNFLDKILGRKKVEEEVLAKSDEHELCENEDNQGEPVQLPSGE